MRHNADCQYTESHYAECNMLTAIVPSVNMPRIFMLNSSLLGVVIPIVIRLNEKAPFSVYIPFLFLLTF
jgi:hypothetical protein